MNAPTSAELINSLADAPRRAAIEELLSRAAAAEKRVEELLEISKRVTALAGAERKRTVALLSELHHWRARMVDHGHVLDLLLDKYGDDEP